MNNKNHYRKVFKSDHLSSYDLEDFLENGVLLEFTIKEVKQFELGDGKKGISVAGKTIGANIAYFKEDIKPMVLNATNSKIMAKLTGSSFVEDWKDVFVELYVLKGVRLGKETTQGIRIKELPPKALGEKEIAFIKENIKALENQGALNKYYSSMTAKEKTNREVNEALKEKQLDLKQTA